MHKLHHYIQGLETYMVTPNTKELSSLVRNLIQVTKILLHNSEISQNFKQLLNFEIVKFIVSICFFFFSPCMHLHHIIPPDQ